MNRILGWMRLIALLVLIGGIGGALWAWLRDRTAPPAPDSPPEWPPLRSVDDIAPPTASSGGGADDARASAAADQPIPDGGTSTSDVGAAADGDGAASPDGVPSASLVNALVDTPDARSSATDGSWIQPDDDGQCPLTHPVKANDNSGIFHVPNGRFYARTKAERCYTTPEAAEADGYRRAKS